MRHDLYGTIHKAIRRHLMLLLADTGAADPADRAGAGALAKRFADIVSLLDDHARVEDAYIHPVLAGVAPEVVARLAAAHQTFEATIPVLVEGYTSLEDATDHERAQLLREAYRGLSGFVATYFMHMQEEEERANGALWIAFSDAALLEIHNRILASIPPESTMRSLRIMAPALNVDERAAMLGGIRQKAPREAFESALSIFRESLSSEDFRQLEARLGLSPDRAA